MNKPLKRLIEGKPGERIVYIGNGFLPSYEDFQRAFILEEQKPMEPKKEMTAKDAWIAMANGECVKAGDFVQKIESNTLQYWDSGHWRTTTTISKGPYSIVPDPSKPEVDEYGQDRCKVVESRLYPTVEDERTALICFIEKHFVRKEAK
jgi:hypothetical protein